MKIIAYHDRGWFENAGTEFSMWSHLCRAYGIDVQIVRHWSEAETENRRVVLFDELGDITLDDHQPDHDAVYVFGRTAHNLVFEVGDDCAEVVRIDTPNVVPLFGLTAAAVFLGSIKRWP